MFARLSSPHTQLFISTNLAEMHLYDLALLRTDGTYNSRSIRE